jgi:hypothetical protein
MRYLSIALILLLCFTAFGQTPDKKPAVGAFSGPPDERASTRVLYWNQEKDAAAGELSIDYGRPVWQKGYEDTAKFDAFTKGKVWRMGNNFWTVFDSNLPVKISGKDVPVGSWYVGLHRSDDGATWSLAFIDPAKVRAAHTDAFEINNAPVAFKIPVTVEPADEMKDKLTIVLTSKKENIKEVTLKINWGKLQLSAPIQVTVQT